MKTWGIGYEKSKEKARQIYRKIGIISSPALGGSDVVFGAIGFNHLVRKGRIPRPRNEQKKRFVLLEYVEAIIKNPVAKIKYRQEIGKVKINRYGKILLKDSIIHFWTFFEKIEDCEVKVVISQVESGKKHFLSIMGNNVQIDNKNYNHNK